MSQLQQMVEEGKKHREWMHAAGAFLRLDIPMIIASAAAGANADAAGAAGGAEAGSSNANASVFSDPSIEQQYVLYTDTDVMFLKVGGCSGSTWAPGMTHCQAGSRPVVLGCVLHVLLMPLLLQLQATAPHITQCMPVMMSRVLAILA
jgi:hypothetical protein